MNKSLWKFTMTLEMLELYPYKNDKFLATLEMFELY